MKVEFGEKICLTKEEIDDGLIYLSNTFETLFDCKDYEKIAKTVHDINRLKNHTSMLIVG